jgi:F-type H+-transporting ATPase subunit alpha
VAGTLRLDLAQYRELAAFAQFGSDLDKATQAQLARGQRLVELLKQDQYAPLPVARQVLALYAGINGFVDDVSVEDIRPFELALYRFVDNGYPSLWQKLMEKKQIDDAMKQEFAKVLAEFKQRFQSDRAATVAAAR